MSDVRKDPRWDTEGFNDACELSQMLWVRVGWIQGLAAAGGRLALRHDLPEEAVGCIGAPPPKVALYCVSYAWGGRDRPDPTGLVLRGMVRALEADGAAEDDLVWIDCLSTFLLADRTNTTQEEELSRKQFICSHELRLHHRVRLLCLPDVPEGSKPYFERGRSTYEFATAAYTSRIITSQLQEVAAHMRPEIIMNFDDVIDKCDFGDFKTDRVYLKKKRRELAESMPPAKEDSAGFRAACVEAQFRWVRVGFLRLWRDRRGPPPRHQDLPRSAYVDGAVPAGRQAFVVSYAWAAHLHPFPDGGKVRQLVAVLDELGAEDTDLVFLDFMSLPQEGRVLPRAYKDVNPQAVGQALLHKVVLPDRTPELNTQFRLALFETTRLYAYQECKVIVLPTCADHPESFSKPEDIKVKLNTFCEPPRVEKDTPYGFCKTIPYENGGWTCAEYAVARKNGTIANAHHKDVQRVEAARKWPDTVREFADMMDENSPTPVWFTKKGDREGVRFNFYKYCYRLTDKDE